MKDIFQKGLVQKSISGEYSVIYNNELYVCKPRGVFRHNEANVKVGDYVDFDPINKIITKVYPRKNDLIRPVIANVDKAFLVISSEGSDEVSLTVPQLPVSKIAKMIGKHLDTETGALMDSGEPTTKYFAIGYRLLFTDGTYRYVWRHKGQFKLGDEAAKSKDDSTDSNNQTVTFTGITTNHNFTKTGKGSKAIVVDERDGKCDVSTWFEAVVTPDTVKAKVSA